MVELVLEVEVKGDWADSQAANWSPSLTGGFCVAGNVTEGVGVNTVGVEAVDAADDVLAFSW